MSSLKWKKENRHKQIEYQNRWKKKNPERARAVRARHKERKLAKLGRLKMLYGCEICRARPHPCALDLHHRDPKTKNFSLSTRCVGKSWKTIREEVKKCAVLCSNCHRRVEYGDLTL